jgi:hypothetical protein
MLACCTQTRAICALTHTRSLPLTQNKKSRLVVQHGKIARHYLAHSFWIDLICSLPIDWFVFAASSNLILSACMRIPKMVYIIAVFRDSRAGLVRIRGDVQLYGLILLGLHLFSCLLFLLGNTQKEDEYTWYKPPKASTDKPAFEYIGFGQFNDPVKSAWTRVWRQYLLCFYWVINTVTTNGVLGDGSQGMYPKNFGELAFVMVCVLVHLTIFQLVLGVFSSSVLKSDEELMKARKEIGLVETYLNSFDFDEKLNLEIKRHFQDAGTTSNSAAEILDSVSTSLRLEISSKQTGKCLDGNFIVNVLGY